MLWFNFILGLNFIFLCFKLIVIHYHTQQHTNAKESCGNMRSVRMRDGISACEWHTTS